MTFIWFWVAELALALAAYLVLGGFDLGVGLLSGVVRSSTVRGEMVDTISPVWDGNGTWLVIAGTILFGAFPGVYAIVLPALYIPLTAMLAGLVLRGVAIEFRHKAVSSRGIWDAMLCLGSFLAAFAQGVSVGTYALGAGWLILKSEGALQQFARAATTRLVPLTVLVAGSVFILTLRMHPVVAERWFAHPVMFVLPTLSLGALVAYTYVSYSVFRGKLRLPAAYS
ncbi:MAG: cytochrome d ubiquinol oxidase subunit II [Steroidobacteraceae bacterium]